MPKKLLVTNIQRMCMHDGPGLRTTVFLKGCNLHCPWCANPENIHFYPEEYKKNGRTGVYGTFYTVQELETELKKDQNFWRYGGGVTFSGGEPLMHVDNLLPLLEKLKSDNIHVAVETALHVEAGQIRSILPYIGLFIVDLKILLPALCQDILGGDVERYYQNLELLQQNAKEMIFRIPCNWEYTLREDNLDLIFKCLKKYSHIPVEIFPTHLLGRKKYESMELECREWRNVSAEVLDGLAKKIERCGNSVIINSI